MVLLEDSNVIPVCCGSAMEELKPQIKDGGQEKHVPVVEINEREVCVTVGEQLHPMIPEHYIKWIVLVTNKGRYMRCLRPGDEPKACFTICQDEIVVAAYEFCNIHSLWGKLLNEEENGC